MPRVSILSRDESYRHQPSGKVEVMVSVRYSTPIYPPRDVALPLDSYRPATSQERAAAPQIAFLPANPQALEAERKAIHDDLSRFVAGALPTLDYE